MPNAAIASAFVMPPSTTAEAAATFCPYVYLPCFPSMRSSTSLPNARYSSCHLLTASAGSERAIAADLYPCPSSKSPMAAFLASTSCFTLKSTRIKKASHFSCPRNGRQFTPGPGRFCLVSAKPGARREALLAGRPAPPWPLPSGVAGLPTRRGGYTLTLHTLPRPRGLHEREPPTCSRSSQTRPARS